MRTDRFIHGIGVILAAAKARGESLLCSNAELADIDRWWATVNLTDTKFCGWTDCQGGHYWRLDGGALTIEPHESQRYCDGPTHTSG